MSARSIGPRRRELLARADVSGANHGFNIPAHVEITDDFHFPRIEQRDQVIEHDIDDVFVEDALVAILIDVELETLELDAPFAWDVLDMESSEVRKTGCRADTGELRQENSTV